MLLIRNSDKFAELVVGRVKGNGISGGYICRWVVGAGLKVVSRFRI